MPSKYLMDIVEKKKDRINRLKRSYTKEILPVAKRPSFKEALNQDGLSIIGEIKKASPSKGVIKEDFDPYAIAGIYDKHVEAISILTEQDFFKGDVRYVENISKDISIPILQKDFFLDEIQIYQAKNIGASAILLIVAILEDKEIVRLSELAKKLDLDVLVEVHTLQEIRRIEGMSLPIIGINNRNLEDFSVSLDTTKRLREYLPQDTIVVSESGIHTYEDIRELSGYKIDAMLIGESLMRSNDIAVQVEVFRDAWQG